MIRIVCPFCHIVLDPSELEVALASNVAFLICPECDQIMVSEGPARDDSATALEAGLVNA